MDSSKLMVMYTILVKLYETLCVLKNNLQKRECGNELQERLVMVGVGVRLERVMVV